MRLGRLGIIWDAVYLRFVCSIMDLDWRCFWVSRKRHIYFTMASFEFVHSYNDISLCFSVVGHRLRHFHIRTLEKFLTVTRTSVVERLLSMVCMTFMFVSLLLVLFWVLGQYVFVVFLYECSHVFHATVANL